MSGVMYEKSTHAACTCTIGAASKHLEEIHLSVLSMEKGGAAWRDTVLRRDLYRRRMLLAQTACIFLLCKTGDPLCAFITLKRAFAQIEKRVFAATQLSFEYAWQTPLHNAARSMAWHAFSRVPQVGGLVVTTAEIALAGVGRKIYMARSAARASER